MTTIQSDFFCPGCNQISNSIYLYHKMGMPIIQCPNCGLGKACPDEFNPETYYDASYFNGNRPDGYSDYLGARYVLQNHFRQELELLKKLGAGRGELLELGCAYGYFLELAQHHYKVNGLEICEDAVAVCQTRGLVGVQHGAITAEKLAPMPMMDIVVMFDVIEHLSDPGAALKSAASKLRPNGLLVITTGDFSSLFAKTMGRHWRLMTPPQHLWFFTPKSLKKMGDNLGLELIYIDHPIKKVPLGLIAYQLCRYLSLSPRLPTWMHRVGLPINLFDAMRVVFKKKQP